MPVVNAAVLPAATGRPRLPDRAAGPPPASVPAPARAAPPPARASGRRDRASAAPRPAPGVGPSVARPRRPRRPPTLTGSVRAYTLAGGRVTLEVTPTSVQLVTAVPDAGYAVQTWSGTGWLRVDFSSGPQVSSLIASWYEHAPTITVTN